VARLGVLQVTRTQPQRSLRSCNFGPWAPEAFNKQILLIDDMTGPATHQPGSVRNTGYHTSRGSINAIQQGPGCAVILAGQPASHLLFSIPQWDTPPVPRHTPDGAQISGWTLTNAHGGDKKEIANLRTGAPTAADEDRLAESAGPSRPTSIQFVRTGGLSSPSPPSAVIARRPFASRPSTTGGRARCGSRPACRR
jgi:hypothetical protein